MFGELGAFFAHPGFELGNQGGAVLLSDVQAFLIWSAVNRSLDIEQGVDSFDGLERHGRDDHLLFASGLRFDIGKLEEFAPAMGPTERLYDQPWFSLEIKQLVETGVMWCTTFQRLCCAQIYVAEPMLIEALPHFLAIKVT